MQSRKTEETMALMLGAALGAAAMYFLDPQAGEDRRKRVASAAEGAMDEARHHTAGWMSHWGHHAAKLSRQATTAAQQLADHARDLADHAQDAANEAVESAHGVAGKTQGHASHLRDMGMQWWNRARGWAKHAPDLAADHVNAVRDQIAGRTEDLRRTAAQGISKASHRAQSWLGHEESSGFGTGTLLSSTIGCCAVGAGLMYFLDSEKGSARRTKAANWTSQCLQRTSESMRSIGKDVSNWLRGSSHGAENRVARRPIDSEDLIRRIRAEIAQSSTNADQVQFMADADGTVTVTGTISRDQVENLLTTLHGVSGVEHVINRLTYSTTGSSQPAPSSAAQR